MAWPVLPVLLALLALLAGAWIARAPAAAAQSGAPLTVLENSAHYTFAQSAEFATGQSHRRSTKAGRGFRLHVDCCQCDRGRSGNSKQRHSG